MKRKWRKLFSALNKRKVWLHIFYFKILASHFFSSKIFHIFPRTTVEIVRIAKYPGVWKLRDLRIEKWLAVDLKKSWLLNILLVVLKGSVLKTESARNSLKRIPSIWTDFLKENNLKVYSCIAISNDKLIQDLLWYL